MNRQSQGYLEAATGTFLGAIVGAYLFCFLAATCVDRQAGNDWLKAFWGLLALVGGGWSSSVCGAWLALKAARCQYAGETARSIAQILALTIFSFFWLVPQSKNPHQLGDWIALILIAIGVSARYLTLRNQQAWRTRSKSRSKAITPAQRLRRAARKESLKLSRSLWLRRPIPHRKARPLTLASLSREGGIFKRDFLES